MAWDDEQIANARVIVAVGRDMGMSSRDILIALMAAVTESGLRNVKGGDRDSEGLFQQRPSQGWGEVYQVRNPIYAATQFYKHLKNVKNRTQMGLGAAAQAVQRSAYPDRYATHENDMRRLMMNMGVKGAGLPFPLNVPGMDLNDYADADDDQTLGEALKPAAGISSPMDDKRSPGYAGVGAATDEVFAPPQPIPVQPSLDPTLMPGMPDFTNVNAWSTSGSPRDLIVQAALGVRGTPYSWGGGGKGGKSEGFAQGDNIIGFDCSGLVQFALAKAGINAPRIAYDQLYSLGAQTTNLGELQPGDLVGPRDGHHIGIYIGNGMMVHAPSTGDVVKIAPVRRGYIGVKLRLAATGSTYGYGKGADTVGYGVMSGASGNVPAAGLDVDTSPAGPTVSSGPVQLTTYAGI